MERTKKLLIAQTQKPLIPSPSNTPGVGNVKNTIDNVNQWDQAARGGVNGETTDNDPKPERVIDPLDQMNQADQQARASFLSQGLDGSIVDATVNAFMQKGMKQTDARQFMNTLVSVANSSSANVAQIIPIALGLYNRFNNVTMLTNVLEEIGQYAGKIPDMNLWGIAQHAANGQPVTGDLAKVAMALWENDGYRGNPTQYRQIMSDIVALFDPNSNLGVIMDNFNKARNHRRMVEEGVKLDFATSQAEWWKQAEQNMGQQMEKLQKSLPKFLHSPEYAVVMRLMTGIVAISKAWQIRSDMVQLRPTGSPAPAGWSTPTAAAEAARQVLAQMPPSPSPSLPTGPNYPAQNLPQNMDNASQGTNNANQGQGSPGYQQQTTRGGQGDTMLNAMARFDALDVSLGKTFDSMWQMLNSMISGGNAGDTSTQTPYLTPQQIQQASVQLSQIASNGYDNAQAALQNVTGYESSASGYQSEVSRPLNPDNTGGPYANSPYVHQQNIIQIWTQKVSVWQMRKVWAMDIGVVGPIVQQIESLKPYVEYYKSQIALSKSTMRGVGSNVYVMPMVQYRNQIAGLYMQAAQHYAQISGSAAGNPPLAQFANRQRERYMMEAAKSRNEGIQAISELSGMMGNRGNDMQLGVANAAVENQLVRLAEELNKLGETEEEPVEADHGEGDYYDLLYKGTDVPNYGDALDDPKKYRDVLTPNIGKTAPRKKKIKLDL